MSGSWWTASRGDGPFIAVAVHAGHETGEEVGARLALTPQQRRREEDPFTDIWAAIAPTRIVMHRSRFAVDLNRPGRAPSLAAIERKVEAVQRDGGRFDNRRLACDPLDG